MQVVNENHHDDMLWILWRHGRTNTSCHSSPSIPSYPISPKKSWTRPLGLCIGSISTRPLKYPGPADKILGLMKHQLHQPPETVTCLLRHEQSHPQTLTYTLDITTPYWSILCKWLLSLQNVWAKPKALCRPLQLTSAYGEMRCDETESLWNLEWKQGMVTYAFR